ncbi:MAG TPA: UDP-N-acetylmuramate dehydrogenase [Stellaceae bacterium]|nr:UDP-N-acetylmuramate dehydrogenase [Stellaceae bacterium]
MIAASSVPLPAMADAFPATRGRLIANAPLGRRTWLGAGGPAELLFRPADRDDLAAFLAGLPADVAVTMVGGGANLLVRDGGVPGVTIRLGGGFTGIAIDGTDLVVGAGALHRNVALAAAAAGIGGLEFLSGIPGTIGGGLRLNAGAYGGEIGDVLVSATALDRCGRQFMINAAAISFSYRHSDLDPGAILIEARLRGSPGTGAAIAARIDEIRRIREATQPIRARTGGSTFKNPPGQSAWRLIDAAGCRGLARGDAMVSPHHPNFLINTGRATAGDLEGLGEEVRRRVRDTSGTVLEWEIHRIGRPLGGIAPLAGQVPS